MKKVVKVIIGLCIIGLIIVLSINKYVCDSYDDKIIDVSDVNQVDVIVVLGAKVNGNDVSMMLKDRLDKAIEVYDSGISNNILVSGNAEEVNAMKNYVVNNGVDEKNVIMDSKGLSTYDSVYRLDDVYQYDNVVIITQQYHLYRALYIANEIGIDAYGVSADDIKYRGQLFRDVREILARNKDYVLTLVS